MKTKKQLQEISDSVYNKAINKFWDSVNLITWQEYNELTELELATVFWMISDELKPKEIDNEYKIYNDITI